MQLEKKRRLLKRRTVLQLLKERAYRYTELVKQTKLPQKTMDRILEELKTLGLIIKKKDGAWVSSEHIRKPYKTKSDYDVALEHSKKLLCALEAILVEDKLEFVEMSITQESPWAGNAEAFRIELESEYQGQLLKEFAEAHLRTGYSSVYKKLEAYRDMNRAIRSQFDRKSYSKELIDFVVDGLQTLPRPGEVKDWPRQFPKELEGMIKEKLDDYHELASDIRQIEMKVIIGGAPLDGSCPLCPKVSIME